MKIKKESPQRLYLRACQYRNSIFINLLFRYAFGPNECFFAN
jgi:hypothetical protein